MNTPKLPTWLFAVLFFLPMLGAGIYSAAIVLSPPPPVPLERSAASDGREVETHRAQLGWATAAPDGRLVVRAHEQSLRWPVLTLAVRNFDRWIMDAAYAEPKAMGTMFTLLELQEWDGGMNRGADDYATMLADALAARTREAELKKIVISKDAEAALSADAKKAREEKIAEINKRAADAGHEELVKEQGRLRGYYPVVNGRYSAWNFALRSQVRLVIAGRIFESLAPFDVSAQTMHGADSFNLFVFKVQPGETEHAAWGELVRMVGDQCQAPITVALKVGDNWLRLPTEVNANNRKLLATAGASGDATTTDTANAQSFTLALRPGVMKGLAIGAALQVLMLVLVLAHFTTVLRDPRHPKLPASKKAPWSLSRVTLAWWLMLCTASFLYVWTMTDNVNNLSATAVILLGINGATLLTATLAPKQKVVRDGDAPAPAESEPEESRGLLSDIISERGEPEVARLQMIVWNGVLGVVFAWQTVATWTMPDFDATLMTLLGISSTAYVGFKFAAK
ncbi:MAG: hypothetical protein ABMA13_15605 [Chthoniobacteraceae bacterium]